MCCHKTSPACYPVQCPRLFFLYTLSFDCVNGHSRPTEPEFEWPTQTLDHKDASTLLYNTHNKTMTNTFLGRLCSMIGSPTPGPGKNKDNAAHDPPFPLHL